MSLLVEEWETKADEDTFVIHLREGVQWSDGSDFTSADVVSTFDVGRLFKWTVFKYVDEVTALDDNTVEFHMAEPSTVVERYVLAERIRSRATYGELADRVAELIESGADDESDEWNALVQEVTEFRPEELIVTGPFNIDMNSVTEAQLTLVKNPESYLADTVRFDSVVLYNGETPVVTPLVLAGDVDYATHGFPPATESAFAEQGLRIVRAPTYSGPALFFNHDLYPLNLPEVRQAIAYAINREENGTVSLGDSGRAVEMMAGLSDNLVPLWLSEDQIAELNTYEYDPAQGEELLTGIGFTRGDDGAWIDDQGNPLEFELTAPAEFADWSAAAENASEQLNNFGIRTTVRGVQFQQHLSDVNQGNFEIATRAWGIGSNPHPHFAYTQNLFTHNFVASTEGAGMNFPMQQEVNGEEVDFEQLVVQSAEGLDPEAQEENVAALAKAFNEILPVVPLWERYGNNPVLETRVGGWPADNDPLYNNAVYGDNFVTMWILDGTLGPAQ
ncbi:MAG: peptide ABC transporter substrate-binding protein [Geodermatophilaceae bacterium]|nr:peptide ABC transporter substrate-binding protein [Geodermatophilaceae bacterium]